MKLSENERKNICDKICIFVVFITLITMILITTSLYYVHQSENKYHVLTLSMIGLISGLTLIIFLLALNISKRKKAENELSKINNELEQIIKEKTANLQQKIFERKQTEKKLQENLHFMELLIDTIPTPIFFKDTEGKYLRCNEAFATNICYSKKEIVGQSSYDVAPKHLADIYYKADAALLRNPGTQVYESTIQLTDGTYRNVIFNKATYTNTDGNIAGIVGIITDITNLKEMESKIKESEEKYRLVFENAPLGIYQFDNNGIINACNKSLAKIIGSCEESLIGLDLMNLSNTRELTTVKKALSGELGYYEGNYLAASSNKAIYVKVNTAPLKRAGIVIGGIGIMEDITELRHTQNMMREKDKLAIVGQMAAGVAHEIRNPLTSVKGFAELMMKKFSDNATLVGYTSIIIDEANQANRVITDFLQLASSKEPELKKHDLNSLLKEIMDIVEPQAYLSNVKVEYVENNLPQCLLDRNQMKQVLLNMCKNAFEAMPDGGMLKIQSGLSPQKNEVYIDIQDTGCGIPQDKLDKLGVPFYTTKDDGTGLGLSISYSIIDAHNGRVEVDSTQNLGTRFRIVLVTGD